MMKQKAARHRKKCSIQCKNAEQKIKKCSKQSKDQRIHGPTCPKHCLINMCTVLFLPAMLQDAPWAVSLTKDVRERASQAAPGLNTIAFSRVRIRTSQVHFWSHMLKSCGDDAASWQAERQDIALT